MPKIIKRSIFSEIAKHMDTKEVTVIVGARQTGKTTLLLQLREFLINQKSIKPSQIKFYNLDLISDLEQLKSQDDFIKFLKEQLINEKFVYVFIDESQKLENPGVFLKGIYDLNLSVKFVVSGSSSLEIKSKMFESLTGRKRIFHLWTFSFEEYLTYLDPDIVNLITEDISKITEDKLTQYLYDFLIFGGYPRVVSTESKEEKIQVLNEIYSSYIERDIVGFMKIKNPLGFSKLVTILADQCGGLVNFKELNATLSINFRTLENYISILENTFVIKCVKPYYTNIRKELTKMPKIFFADNGLMNFAVRNFTEFKDNLRKGKIIENYIFSSLLKVWNGTINYWRTKEKNEVDFILRDFYGNVIPVETKATSLKKPEIPYGLKAFIEQYKPSRAILVNLSLKQKIKIGKGKNIVKFIIPCLFEPVLKSLQKS